MFGRTNQSKVIVQPFLPCPRKNLDLEIFPMADKTPLRPYSCKRDLSILYLAELMLIFETGLMPIPCRAFHLSTTRATISDILCPGGDADPAVPSDEELVFIFPFILLFILLGELFSPPQGTFFTTLGNHPWQYTYERVIHYFSHISALQSYIASVPNKSRTISPTILLNATKWWAAPKTSCSTP